MPLGIARKSAELKDVVKRPFVAPVNSFYDVFDHFAPPDPRKLRDIRASKNKKPSLIGPPSPKRIDFTTSLDTSPPRNHVNYGPYEESCKKAKEKQQGNRSLSLEIVFEIAGAVTR